MNVFPPVPALVACADTSVFLWTERCFLRLRRLVGDYGQGSEMIKWLRSSASVAVTVVVSGGTCRSKLS